MVFQPGFDSGSSDEAPQNPVTGVGGRARSHKSAAPGGSGGGSISRAVFALRRALRAARSGRHRERAAAGVRAAPGTRPEAGCGGGPGGVGSSSRGRARRRGREPRPAAGRGEVQAAPGGRAAVGVRAASGARPEAGCGGGPGGAGSPS
ncbi:hypothetical protein PVAP13_3KG128998 [Panicum virgatum]|uniref:Uncharacterized protein n=1 Tax=Panicum virgatum TaxID=38727 RepID=A0A8T0V2I3_PANVG|nr:hypothetical protein PVAP13_3KG128998 [Panicum virgatum]